MDLPRSYPWNKSQQSIVISKNSLQILLNTQCNRIYKRKTNSNNYLILAYKLCFRNKIITNIDFIFTKNLTIKSRHLVQLLNQNTLTVLKPRKSYSGRARNLPHNLTIVCKMIKKPWNGNIITLNRHYKSRNSSFCRKP